MNSTLGFVIVIGLLVATLLLIWFFLKLIGECWKWGKARYQGNTYVFHLPNPLQSFKQEYATKALCFRNLAHRFIMAIRAFQDILWLIQQTHDYDTKRKHAFMAYSAMLFFSGAVMSDLWDYSLKIDWIHIVTDFLKAIQ